MADARPVAVGVAVELERDSRRCTHGMHCRRPCLTPYRAWSASAQSAESHSALPQEQRSVTGPAGERVGTARPAEIHGGAVIRAFLKLDDERHRAGARGTTGSLVRLNPGGTASKLTKHGRLGSFTSRRPGFPGKIVVILGLAFQGDGPHRAEHERCLLGTLGPGQRCKAIQWEEQGPVSSGVRIPVVAHARVVLAGEQGNDSSSAVTVPSSDAVQDDLGKELQGAFA